MTDTDLDALIERNIKRNKPHTPDSFWALVAKVGDCWEWQGTRSYKNYGSLRWNGSTTPAHRVAALLGGLIFDLEFRGQNLILHHCDNPPCCRPEHLFAGTHTDNSHDKMRKGRFVPTLGDRHPRVKMSDAAFCEALKLVEAGEEIQGVSRFYGVSRQALSDRIQRHYRRMQNARM